MADLATIQANIAKAQGAIERLNTVYMAKGRLSPKQNASFTTWRDKLVRFQREEAAWHATHSSPTFPLPIALGPDPVPNNSVPDGNTFGCEEGFDRKAFEALYGYTIEHAFDLIVTSLLRPRMPYTAASASIQADMLAYFAGKRGFATVVGHIGAPFWYGKLGCVDVTKIHDLGA